MSVSTPALPAGTLPNPAIELFFPKTSGVLDLGAQQKPLYFIVARSTATLAPNAGLQRGGGHGSHLPEPDFP